MLPTLERIERDKLADRVTVYRRGAEALYSNTLQDGEWTREPQARAVVEAERNRAMTLQERRDYAMGFEKLAGMLERSERAASPEELRRMDDLRQQATNALAAEVFRQEPPATAVQQHPSLAPAYGVLAAVDKQTEADGLTTAQRAQVADRTRENIAASIERGETPQIRIREERVAGVVQRDELER
jgi:hypothetical protein